MSLMRTLSVQCDGLNMRGTRHAPGCSEWSSEGPDAVEVRRDARRWGWVRRNGYDYSPECDAALRAPDTSSASDTRQPATEEGTR